LTLMKSADKIKSIDEIASIAIELRKSGKTIAQCHGCFDLLHPGHIKHFEAAERLADIVIVTLTPDRFVNKGPGRPAFNEHLRLESIAALQAVDYAVLNEWSTAEEAIKIIKPNVYVKGQDYQAREKDITGNIFKEEHAVKEVGGEIHFTEEIVFSSSSLLNTHFSPYNEKTREYLAVFKKKNSADKINKELERLEDISVLVIGDTIIDEYHYCQPLGKSTKSPNISAVYLKQNVFAGGVLAVANHLNQFAKNVEMVTVLGKDNSQREVIDTKLSKGVSKKLFYRADGPTNTKRRYLDTYLDIKLFEVTFMNDKHIDEKLEKEIISHLRVAVRKHDMILVTDFGHGFITPAIIEFLESTGKFMAVNAQTNSNNYGYNYITKYRKAGFVSIDERELRLPFSDSHGKIEELVRKLKKTTRAEKIQITLGASGSTVFAKNKFFFTPAFATSIRDSVGAGDAVLSVTALCAYNGVAPEVISFVGNCVGALAVRVIGNEHPVYKRELTKYIQHFLK
jgi:rfaE bifunctional protein kinase chain/domain/rfaE bifunctional protein nucleotidyltransferase chain/domain